MITSTATIDLDENGLREEHVEESTSTSTASAMTMMFAFLLFAAVAHMGPFVLPKLKDAGLEKLRREIERAAIAIARSGVDTTAVEETLDETVAQLEMMRQRAGLYASDERSGTPPRAARRRSPEGRSEGGHEHRQPFMAIENGRLQR